MAYPNLPLAAIASSNLATSTKPPQPLPATLDPSLIIIAPDVSEASKLEHLNFPIKTTSPTHPRTSQRLPHHNTTKNTMHNELKKTKKNEMK